MTEPSPFWTMPSGRRNITPEEAYRRLDAHLRTWLGAWPANSAVQVVGSERRAIPGWDGEIHNFIGVSSPRGTVLSVAPDRVDSVRSLGKTLDDIAAGIGPVLGFARGQMIGALFRWSDAPAPLPDAGIWLPSDDPRVPEWLVPFGGDVLITLDDGGAYIAGVGIKRHDPWGHEISVGTEPAARGRGLARRLVTQAARRIIDQGEVPTYLHEADNIASARVADAAGFPDRGWRVIGFRAD